MNKEAYVEKLKAQLDEWNADLERMEAQARGAKADLKIKYDQQLTGLRQRQSEAKQKLEEVKAANNEAWEQLKQGTEDAWNRLKEAVTSAKSQFD